MRLQSLHLQHFRSYSEGHFEFDDRINFIYGDNAQGKTNLLEAIYYLMIGQSFRTQHQQDLIQYEHPAFYLESHFSKHSVDQCLRIRFNSKDKKILHNSTTIQNTAGLLGILQGVIITPDDINLIKGSPLLRRQFLDLHLAKVDPLYVHHLTRYSRALRQRNQLLKSRKPQTIESWEQEMAYSAGYIISKRVKAINELQTQAHHFHQKLTEQKYELTIQYKSGGVPQPYEPAVICENQLKLYQKYRDRELFIGHTLTGLHKDDLLFSLDGKETRLFASEGQQRTYVTALRLAEWQHLNETTDAPPLMMIDDVGMGLDFGRREHLFSLIADLNQVFLTATDSSLFDSIQVKGKKIKIERL